MLKGNHLIFRFFRQVPGWQDSIQLYDQIISQITASAKLCIVSITITSLILGMRQIGWLEPLELSAFDEMMRFRSQEQPDSRLLLVSITEKDIENLNEWPLSDLTVAHILEKLTKLQPRVIGLDLYRHISHSIGANLLITQLQNPNLIVVTSNGNTPDEQIRPPANVPNERIGFSDLLIDPDGVVRRHYVYSSDGNSLSLQLALAYLDKEHIAVQANQNKLLQLNKVVLIPLKVHSGSYKTINTSGYQILLNYRGYQTENIARSVNITQLLNDQVNPEWVKDKIVLIGTTAPSGKDLFNTPYSATKKGNRKMAGIVIHAQMTSQLISAALDQRPLLSPWSEWLEILWISTWAFIGGIVGWRIHHPVWLGLTVLLLLIGLFALGMWLFIQGTWIPIAAPLLAAILTTTVVVVYQLNQAIRQHQMMMKLLGQQTSPAIANALWNSRVRLLNQGILPGQNLTATILLTDIKGFSTISEKKPPETVMSWLNEYLSAMTQVVQSHQGVINKFTGDGLMAVFGVPVPRTTEAEIAQDAQRAVACALAMRDRLEALNISWDARSLPMVQMRIGIFTGPVMVGSLGGKDRLEYGVIGNSVNIASRLESYEKERLEGTCRILIAQETLNYLQEKFAVESWGWLQLRGKQEQVNVYLVVGTRLSSSLP